MTLLKIWIITLGEPLPDDGGNPRLLKSMRFALWLSKRGYQVTFFTNRFDHYNRKLRSHTSDDLIHFGKVQVVFLDGIPYHKSVSVKRVLHHIQTSIEFKQKSKNFTPPDVLLCSFPTLAMCRVALKYAKTFSKPIIIDIRDFWPDAIISLAPRAFHSVLAALLKPLRIYTQKVLQSATALSSNSKEGLTWAKGVPDQHSETSDFVFPLSYPNQKIEEEKNINWDEVHIAFFGALTQKTNIIPFVNALIRTNSITDKYRLVICGTGELSEKIKTFSQKYSFIKYEGWCDYKRIQEIARRSDVGLLPYSGKEFELSSPNKFSEYLAFGLPVLTSTDGVVRALIEDNKCGVYLGASETEIFDSLMGFDVKELTNMRNQSRALFVKKFSDGLVFSEAHENILRIILSQSY